MPNFVIARPSFAVSRTEPGRNAAAIPYAHQPITNRQLECLGWVQEGKSASDIGEIIGISGRTVEKHLAKLCHHLEVRTRVQAVVKARDLGLLGRT